MKFYFYYKWVIAWDRFSIIIRALYILKGSITIIKMYKKVIFIKNLFKYGFLLNQLLTRYYFKY